MRGHGPSRERPRLRNLLAYLCAAAIALGTIVYTAASGGPSEPQGAFVAVRGNELVDASGQPFRLLGVDRSGTEFQCAYGRGIFYGPTTERTIQAMLSWHVDAVRLPLNEDCWLGINGVARADSGVAYRRAITRYVEALGRAGVVVILDLHWSAPGTELARGQMQMADAEHSPAFWRSVAETFRNDRGVVFDLYNEPYGISWRCWRDGCVLPGGWRTAGMQELVDAVRSTGARQPIMLGGIGYASDLSGWLRDEPHDPLHQLVASFHVYNFSGCADKACWNRTVGRLARTVPVVTGELGQNGCGDQFIDRYMSWADAHGVSYLGWAWDPGTSCSSFPDLVTSWNGTPTPYGAGLKKHLAQLASAGALLNTRRSSTT